MDVHFVKARDIMNKDVIKAYPDMSLTDLAKLLQEKHITGVPVVDRSNKLVGVVSQTDIIRFYASIPERQKKVHPYFKAPGKENESAGEAVLKDAIHTLGDTTVSQIMTEEVFAFNEEVSAIEIARMMVKLHMHRVIIIDEDLNLSGVVSTMDLVRLVADIDRK